MIIITLVFVSIFSITMSRGRSFPLAIVLIVSSSGILLSENCWQSNQRNHNPELPPPRILNYLAGCLGTDIDMESLLTPLLIPRTPGSAGNAAARSYIADYLTGLGWSVQFDTFSQDTVIGQQTFSNIIATKNKDSPRRLVLAAHYDTKISPEGFIGATDSAVPCAMMLHLAKTMDNILPTTSDTPELTLQLVFFDGEEAFNSWTSTDSLYGSRHLANLWAETDYQYKEEEGICQDGVAKELDRIDSFLLIDLLGAPFPSFKRYTQFNTSLYDLASKVEVAVKGMACSQDSNMFTAQDMGWMIQDDHVPFYNLGVRKILHMIASPFPSVWHTMNDNKEALDMDTIDRMNKIVRVFVYSYLN